MAISDLAGVAAVRFPFPFPLTPRAEIAETEIELGFPPCSRAFTPHFP